MAPEHGWDGQEGRLSKYRPHKVLTAIDYAQLL